jgi:glycosyltransferase involved in cell wall biosynthesis
MKENLLKNIKIDLDKIEMIYNPIDLSYIRKKTKEEVPEYLFKKRPVLIACGRLTKEKGFSYLIRAFKDIKKSFPEAKLLILGEGELEEYLKKLSFSLGLKESVYFLGFQKNPFKYIARADIFIFSSLYEGLPSALIEAMACGVPIVSTDCTSGPKEILDNGKVGSLVRVGDSKDLASETIYLLKDDNKRKVYSKKARDKVVNFGIKNNIQKYNSLLNRI